MKNIIILAVVAFAAWSFLNRDTQVILGDGIKAPNEPVQNNYAAPKVIQMDDHVISQFAEFNFTAKVLAKKNYTFGQEAELSPTDLALGWGQMSDEAILADIDISQSGRFYFWRVKQFPIPRKTIETHSANMHFIPANDDVADVLKDVNPGDLVKVQGSLVNVSAIGENWTWNSSRTRNDTGNGACELILVERMSIVSML
jgi:hypothetical protein